MPHEDQDPTTERIQTMIAQFTVLAPSTISYSGAIWRRFSRRDMDGSNPSYPAVGFHYEHPTRGKLTVRLTLNVGADEYEIRVMAEGRAVLDVTDIYVDQLADIQGMISRAEAQVRAMAVA